MRKAIYFLSFVITEILCLVGKKNQWDKTGAKPFTGTEERVLADSPHRKGPFSICAINRLGVRVSANYMPVKIQGTEITLVWTDLIVSLSLSW